MSAEASAMAHGESLWPRWAELPLVVEGCEYDRLHRMVAHAFERVTTHVGQVMVPKLMRKLSNATLGRPRGTPRPSVPAPISRAQRSNIGTPETLGCNVGHD
jgi:hypothetical protein